MKMKKWFLLLLAMAMCLPLCACKSTDYSNAKKLMETGKYDEAIAILDSLEEYQDSAELVKKCHYLIAQGMSDEGKYQEAIEQFIFLGEYEDSAELVKKCHYLIAQGMLDEGKYQEAIEKFAFLGEYEDSKEQIRECNYQSALVQLKKGNELEALKIFATDIDYKDSEEQCVTCICAIAKEGADNGHLVEAISILSKFLEYPEVEAAFCTIMLDELTDNYIPNVQEAMELWSEYLLIWMKEMTAIAEKTPVGKTITPPQIDESAPQIVALRRTLEKANKSIAIIEQAYSDDVMELCAEDIRELQNTVMEFSTVIDNQFSDLYSLAVTVLYYGLQEKNASKAYNNFYNAIYQIEDAVETVCNNRK